MANKISKVKNRRAISSIIGAFFFLVLMVAVFGAILVAFQYQSNLVGTNRAIADKQVNKIQEQFALRPIVTGSGPCNLSTYVDNTGTNSIEILDIWAINTGDGSQVTLRSFTSPNSFVPPGSTTTFLTTPISLTKTGNYEIKAVSALGNTRETQFSCPVSAGGVNYNVIDKLVARPSVYVAFPNPHQEGKEGYYAIIVANPTKNPMVVYRVSLQIIAASNPDFVGTVTGITPTTMWCAGNNVPGACSSDAFFWRNTGGVTIPKYSVSEFSAKLITSSSVKNTAISTVDVNAWTSFGQFGGANINTLAMNKTSIATPSLYLTSSITYPDRTYSRLNWEGTKNYFVAIENKGASKIDKGGTLIVNLPAGFTYGGTCCSSHLTVVTTVPFDDDSTQLRAKLTSDINPNDVKVFAFTATAPTVTADSLYVLYTFLNGTSNGGLVGPVAEPVIQVCPLGSC